MRDVLSWRKSREYFYWRTQRRLAELQLRSKFADADPDLPFEKVGSFPPRTRSKHNGRTGSGD